MLDPYQNIHDQQRTTPFFYEKLLLNKQLFTGQGRFYELNSLQGASPAVTHLSPDSRVIDFTSGSHFRVEKPC